MRILATILALLLASVYSAPEVSRADQKTESSQCRNTCSTFSATLAELSGGKKRAKFSRSFDAYIRSCRRLCAKEGVFALAVLDGIADSLSTLSSEEVRSVMAPPKALPQPVAANNLPGGEVRRRVTARAVSTYIPSPIASFSPGTTPFRAPYR
jgi:hypothetical protein